MMYVTGSFNFAQGFCDDVMREFAGKTTTPEAGNLGPHPDWVQCA